MKFLLLPEVGLRTKKLFAAVVVVVGLQNVKFEVLAVFVRRMDCSGPDAEPVPRKARSEAVAVVVLRREKALVTVAGVAQRRDSVQWHLLQTGK